jgi:hypothetical protein
MEINEHKVLIGLRIHWLDILEFLMNWKIHRQRLCLLRACREEGAPRIFV